MFGQILLLLVVIYCTHSFRKTFPDKYEDVKHSISISAGIWLIGQVYYSIGFSFESFIRNVSTTTSLSILLVAFLMLIRELKPHLFRYPYFTVFIPIIIPFTYIFVYDIPVIRNTILYSIAIIAITVQLLLVIGYRGVYSAFSKGVVGSIFLFLGYMYMMFSETFIYYEFIWHIIVSIGVFLSINSITDTFNQNKI